MRVVLDCNVIVSSYLNASGNPGKILQALHRQQFELVLYEELLTEYERVLSYDRIASLHGMSDDEIDEQIDGLRQAAIVVELGTIPNVITEDRDDNVVIATAISGAVEYIVSGDDDLRRLRRYQGILIVAPAAFHVFLSQ